MWKRFQNFLLSLVRKHLDSSSQGEDYHDEMMSNFDDAYGNVQSSSADALDKFSEGAKSGWQSFVDGLSNWWKGFTGSGLTQRDLDLNAMNMQNVEDTANAQVSGYLKAGVNPALMYGNGASNSAPQSSALGTSGSMSELMQALLLPQQMRMLSAQTRNVEANTQKQVMESGQIKQVMEYYPRLTEHTIAEIVSRQGLNIANMSKAEIEAEIAGFEKIIKSAEADNAHEFYKLRNQYQSAQTEAAKASAAQAMASALWTEYETQYAKDNNGARPSSSAVLALVNAVTGWLGTSPEEQGRGVVRAITSAANKGTDNGKKPSYGTMQDVGRGFAKSTFREDWNKAKRFVKGYLRNNRLSRFQ